MNSPSSSTVMVSVVDSYLSKNPKNVPLETTLSEFREGVYQKEIIEIQRAYQLGGKKGAGPLKKKLPAVLFSGTFAERKDAGILQHSGILVADLDDLPKDRISQLRLLLKEDDYVRFFFDSPTGSGLKVGFRIPADEKGHAAAFEAVSGYVKRRYKSKIDPACRNLSRLCFVSDDPYLYSNPKAAIMPIQEELPFEQQDSPAERGVQALIEKFGKPYYLSPVGAVTSINARFWAATYITERHLLYEPEEGKFYNYIEDRGLWVTITEEFLRELLAERLLKYSREEIGEGFEKKITKTSLEAIIAFLKGQAEKKGAFDQKKRIIHCDNGVLRLQSDGDAEFTEFSVDDYSRNQSPVTFDRESKCPRFLNELILGGVDEEDALLIQKWMGLALLGDNAPHKLLILDGQPGGGKSTLINIIRAIVGSQNAYQLRTDHLAKRFELFHYIGKTLLIGSDVSGKFLMHKDAYVIKSLVGGDPLSAEGKNSNGDFEITGNFNIVISCNTRLKVVLESDIGAWKRRLLIVSYEKPTPEKPIPNFDAKLVEEEGSGILNWALEGLDKAFEDIDETGTLHLTSNQEKRVDALLAESESVRHYVGHCLIKDTYSDVTSDEAVQAYAEYCSDLKWNPLPITVVQQQLPDLMLEFFGTSKSHCLERNGKKALRGWKGVRFADAAPEHLDL